MKEAAKSNTTEDIKAQQRFQTYQQNEFDVPTSNFNSNNWYKKYVKINELGEDDINENTP